MGGLWAGGNQGLFKRKTERGLEEVALFPDKNIIISGMSLDPAGYLWIAALGNGLLRCSWRTRNGAWSSPLQKKKACLAITCWLYSLIRKAGFG